MTTALRDEAGNVVATDKAPNSGSGSYVYNVSTAEPPTTSTSPRPRAGTTTTVATATTVQTTTIVQTTTTVQTTTSAAVVRPVIGRATAGPPTFRIH